MLAALDLPGPVVAFELDLDAVAEPKRRRKTPPDLPAFQPVRRDFAFLVDADRDRRRRAPRRPRRRPHPDRRRALFDVTRATSCRPARSPLAIEVTFQPRERTLTDAEIEAACQKVVAAVAKATGAALR